MRKKRTMDNGSTSKGTGYFLSHLLISLKAGRPRGRMVLSSPNRLAIFVCQSGSPKGLWRFTDSRTEASWLADSGSSTCVSQFASSSTGQGSANSLRHQLDHGQSSIKAAKPDLTGFC